MCYMLMYKIPSDNSTSATTKGLWKVIWWHVAGWWEANTTFWSDRWRVTRWVNWGACQAYIGKIYKHQGDIVVVHFW